MDSDNLKKLISIIDDEIDKKITEISKQFYIPKNDQNIQYIISNHGGYDIVKELGKLIVYKKTIYVCTGYNVDWEEQLTIIKSYFRTLSSKNVKYNTGKERFVSSKCNKQIIYRINNNLYSGEKEHLNKVSLTLGMDNLLSECLSKFLNIDGYISHTVPSLWHRYNIFHEELAIFGSRGGIELVDNDLSIFNKASELDYPYSNSIFKYNTSNAVDKTICDK